MKAEDKFIIPGSLGIWRIRQKEGPPHVFMLHRVDKAYTEYHVEKKTLLKAVEWPKSTPTGQAIRDWLDTFDEAEPAPPEPDKFQEQIKAEGFGPEAHD